MSPEVGFDTDGRRFACPGTLPHSLTQVVDIMDSLEHGGETRCGPHDQSVVRKAGRLEWDVPPPIGIDIDRHCWNSEFGLHLHHRCAEFVIHQNHNFDIRDQKGNCRMRPDRSLVRESEWNADLVHPQSGLGDSSVSWCPQTGHVAEKCSQTVRVDVDVDDVKADR